MLWSSTAPFGTVRGSNKCGITYDYCWQDRNVGNYKHFRSFVRRRRWIRLRHRKKALERPKPLQQQSSNANDVQNGVSEHQETVSTSKQNIDQSQLLQQLKQCRLDRERLSILNDALQHEYAAQELAKQVNQKYTRKLLKQILILPDFRPKIFWTHWILKRQSAHFWR